MSYQAETNRFENIFPSVDECLPKIDHESQVKLMVNICNNSQEVFQICRGIKDPEEKVLNGIPAHAGGFLVVGMRKEGRFKRFTHPIFLGELTREQEMNNKRHVYLYAVLGKCGFAGKNPYSADAMSQELVLDEEGLLPRYLWKPRYTFVTTPNPLPYGVVESHDTQIIIGFSGFLPKKDELFTLSLAIVSGVISKARALEIAKSHNNDLFVRNIETILANCKVKKFSR
ncbi:hypothetical protein M0R04_00035 [Candidatus Dojkabacteria bacterium]|jgi:hypothetical protein|nr:hypothetical protein [Candidatus Dojkabacteria bacterium]